MPLSPSRIDFFLWVQELTSGAWYFSKSTMNQIRTIQLAIVLVSFLGMGCEELGDCERGRGPIVSKQLDLPSFHRLKLSGSDKVILQQGPQQEVMVEGQQNIIDLIRLEVSQGEWDIRTRGCVRQHDRMVYYITLPDIKGLSLAGSGDIIGENTFVSSEIEFEITGSGSITAAIETGAVDAEVTGSGKLILNGNTEVADIEITGSGECDAYSVQAKEVTVDIEGSGKAYVTAINRLKVDIRGSGQVYYTGNPVIHSSISGSGKLIAK